MQQQYPKNKIFYVTVTTLLAVVIASSTLAIQPTAITAQAQAADIPTTTTTNQPQKATLDGINISFEPKVDPASGLTTMDMKVTDEKTGSPLTHVDWVVRVTTPDGKEAFKSSTLHSHVGDMQLPYAFDKPGKNTVSVQTASLGPKMMGIDVPPMALTRIFKSGDPMMGWETDPTNFFGVRNADFIVNAVGSTIQETASSSTTTDNSQVSNVRVLDGSEKGTKVKLEFLTTPQKIIAGQPATLILNVAQADNGTSITHPDALMAVGKGQFTLIDSAQAGSPMMPMHGSFHGHTGQMALTTIFPTPGEYTIDTTVNSLPVSNYIFGNVKTSFNVEVSDA